jgi:lysophospholipase L1-like esterase
MKSFLFTVRYRRSYAHHVAAFKQHPVQPGDLVFLGDSITQGAPWETWFPDRPVHNQGISGDKTEGVLKRLELALGHPAALFLMIGTNDVGDGQPTQRTVNTVERIVATVRERCPDTELYLQSVLPRSPTLAAAIRAVNAGLAEMCPRLGAIYLDFFAAFADEEGVIRPEYSSDELHLTPAGYEVWHRVLPPLVA